MRDTGIRSLVRQTQPLIYGFMRRQSEYIYTRRTAADENDNGRRRTGGRTHDGEGIAPTELRRVENATIYRNGSPFPNVTGKRREGENLMDK